MLRTVTLACILVAVVKSYVSADDQLGDTLFNGKDTAGWKLVNPQGKGSWTAVSEASLDPADDKKLVSKPGEGVLFRADVSHDHSSDLYTEKEFGDCEMHVEFLIPKGSNSGVYLMGQYEVQILDSSGVADDKLRPGDCGGIYHTKAPSTNAMTAPGEWQTFDIVFRAPRFDAQGKKTENAKFVSVIFNGKKIHDNVEVPEPTGGQLPGGERATGPLMFQGNHGIVALRNIRVKPLDSK